MALDTPHLCTPLVRKKPPSAVGRLDLMTVHRLLTDLEGTLSMSLATTWWCLPRPFIRMLYAQSHDEPGCLYRRCPPGPSIIDNGAAAFFHKRKSFHLLEPPLSLGEASSPRFLLDDPAR